MTGTQKHYNTDKQTHYRCYEHNVTIFARANYEQRCTIFVFAQVLSVLQPSQHIYFISWDWYKKYNVVLHPTIKVLTVTTRKKW
jgi:NAD(P)H-nitrite reductase large subunit